MKEFFRLLPYKQASPIYFFIFVTLSFIGDLLNYGWMGLKFSIPFIILFLTVDLLATYKKYKKIRYGK